MKISICFAAASLFFAHSFAQKPIVAGPMPGYVELRTAKIWVQFAANVKEAGIHYKPAGKKQSSLLSKQIQLPGGEFNTAVFIITALDPGTTYSYYITAGANKKFIDSGVVTTQDVWQFRKPAPAFSFLAGGCAYFNEPGPYDRPGDPPGKDSSIFETMANEKAAFMLWTGDNWYTRYPDYSSDWGLHYRASRDRSLPVLQKFLRSMSHYAIWDDHDYGPNNADKSYVFKDASRDVFVKYWANPSYGANKEGTYSMFTYNDVDFFLLDGRWFRSNDEMKDSLNGEVNKEKKMFGDQQMDWLKNALLFSNNNVFTKFRVIVAGSQVLNQVSLVDAMRMYRGEYNELMSFLQDNKINGVIFLTGDRHHTEILKLERKNAYTLYDITISPLTSNPARTRGAEVNNPARVSKEIDVQNYGRFSLSGEGKERKLTVEILGVKGELLDTWSVGAGDLSY
jgi:alkaline phosphatase D